MKTGTSTGRMHGYPGAWVRGAVGMLCWAMLAASASAHDLYLYAAPPAGGTVVPTSRTGLTNGQVVTIQAYPNTGYRFARWSGDIQTVTDPFTNVTTVVMSNTYYITAQFEMPAFTLSITNDGKGTTSPTNGTYTYSQGQVVTLSATPFDGYTFRRWEGDIAGLESGPESYTNRITMDNNKSLKATFTNLFTLTVSDPVGPNSPTQRIGLVAGTYYTAAVSNDVVYTTTNYRWRCVGFAEGSGDIPYSPYLLPQLYYGPFLVTTNSTMRWLWVPQYRLRITAGTGGTTSPQPGDYWYDSNTVVTVEAHANPGYIFLGWYSGTTPLGAGTLTLTMNQPWEVMAKFTLVQADTDGDGMPDAWESRYGLDPNSSVGVHGAFGDPDQDGLPNIVEFLLQNTNFNAGCSPINADSDGDGMDDFYERYMVDSTNLGGVLPRFFVSAAADDGRIYEMNGRDGNPDGDTLWSTEDGYQLPNTPLRNIDEWLGPDNVPPCTYQTLNWGDPGYPFPGNPPGNRPAVVIKVDNPADTYDQSRGNMADTDGDGFDDGFEYTWDKWQQLHAGSNELFVVGPLDNNFFTNTIPAWDGNLKSNCVTRRFNPRVRHPDPDGTTGGPDFDVLYDYESGGVSPYWYADRLEYSAWKDNTFSPGILEAPHTIRRDLYPDRPRSSHPFLIDVDRDGLPDGYEVVFGYDPWSRVTPGAVGDDGVDNPDGDYMAYYVSTNETGSTNRHHQVYLLLGYDCRVAWGRVYPTLPDLQLWVTTPYTIPYSNVEEIRGPDGVIRMTPSSIGGPDDATHPFRHDTDGDGMWDGWEAYVGLNPKTPPGSLEATLEYDGDYLRNIDEFRAYVTTSTNYLECVPLPEWMNKIFPTDPFDADTDGDGLVDGDPPNPPQRGEMGNDNLARSGGTNGFAVVFSNVTGYSAANVPQWQVYTAGVWRYGRCYTSAGLNPCSADTDGDSLPDPWESYYNYTHGGVRGTVEEEFNDPDGDGLANYQEYWVCATYHWQVDKWLAHPQDGNYDATDFFTGSPRPFDWHSAYNGWPYRYIPMRLVPGGRWQAYAYSGTDPGWIDSDDDGMDDYYEVFHGLNPVAGYWDLVTSRLMAGGVPIGTPISLVPFVGDPRTLPAVAGTPANDNDADGLPNDFEFIMGTHMPGSPNYNTDPSPIWFTDIGYANSFVNLYYRPPCSGVWLWSGDCMTDPPPTYAFDFEINEGYDTDNDNVADYDEAVDEQTDPVTAESPIKRRALFLPPGKDAYARTMAGYFYDVLVPPNEVLRSFTVEAWVRPLNPVSGQRQVILERPFLIPQGNPMNMQPGIRVNFRLAISAEGRPYIEYTGDGRQYVSPEPRAQSPFVLPSNQWTHLAGTYQVPTPTRDYGILTLYVNGQVAAQTFSKELPTIGRYNSGTNTGGYLHFTYAAPLVIGAADAEPRGVVSALALRQPAPYDFFSGWIDEVRVWNLARPIEQIRDDMLKPIRITNVVADLDCYYAFSFDDLPDPDHAHPYPAGFDVTMSAIAPLDWPALTWFAAANDRPMYYNNYQYIHWANNAAAHVPVVLPLDLGNQTAARTNVFGDRFVEFANPANPYTFRYLTHRHALEERHPWASVITMGASPAIVDRRQQVLADVLPLRWAQADEDVVMWDNKSAWDFDTDNDGLPDWWEEKYGLDPLVSTGVDGAGGDPDQDGLSNLAEYLAGTDPRKFDTLGLGYSDFYNWSGSVYRIFGELYTDFDGMEDAWEVANGLNPRRYDAQEDRDGDGWSNLAEFMDQTNPNGRTNYPIPAITFHLKYTGLSQSDNLIIMAYSTNTMDGPPDAIFTMADLPTVPVDNQFLDWSGLANYQGQLGNNNIVPGSVRITANILDRFTDDGQGNLVGTWPGSAGTIDYATGAWSLTYTNLAPFGWPLLASYQYAVTDLDFPADLTFRRAGTGHVREGPNWFVAILDENGNGTWDPGEPLGLALYQPIEVRRGEVEVEIGLTEESPGYGRFAWTPIPGATGYRVGVYNLTAPGQPLVWDRRIAAPRTFVHEGDYRCVGTNALAYATFQWYLYDDNSTVLTSGVFNTSYYPLNPETPTLVYPLGDELHYAVNEFVWRMNRYTPQFQITIWPGSTNNAPILNSTNLTTFREADGSYRFRLPIYAGDGAFTNGNYYWRVRSLIPRTNSAWSAIGTFNLNLNDHPQGPYSIAGDVIYVGKASNGVFHVQAFSSAGFGGMPEAQITIPNEVTTNEWPFNRTPFKLRGLRAGQYYVRAFLDQNGNRKRDVWESTGFMVWTNFYRPDWVIIPPSASNAAVYVMFVDTDNDRLPDDWEYQYYTNLTSAGPGPLRGYTVSLCSTNLNVYECYAWSPLNINPTDPNVAGADGLPFRIKDAFGLDLRTDYKFRITGIRPDGTGRAVVSWPALGSGTVTVGAAGLATVAAGGQTIGYQVQRSSDLVNWTDVGTGGSVIYDATHGEFRYITEPNAGRQRYYRYRLTW